jgi:hypothetical protein
MFLELREARHDRGCIRPRRQQHVEQHRPRLVGLVGDPSARSVAPSLLELEISGAGSPQPGRADEAAISASEPDHHPVAMIRSGHSETSTSHGRTAAE